MADQLYVNKPGGVIAQLEDGTSKHLSYGDPVPDNVSSHQKPRDWADTQRRKPDPSEQAIQDAHRRAALAENGQVNSSSSPVPSNYSDLDEDAASVLVGNLASYPDAQAAVIKHELAFGGGRQKVIDAAGEYARAAAGLLIESAPETTQDPTGEALLDEEPVIPQPDPHLLDGKPPKDDAERAAALGGSGGDGIDNLSGADLDKAVADAGIDASTGGSKSDGGLTADEKRDALREARAPKTPSPS